MTLASGKMISGRGSVKGNFTVGNGARLSPGTNGIGTLTFSNSLTLLAGGTNIFKITKAPLTNDVVRIIGALTNGGTLIVTNISGTALAAGDSFKLLNAASYNGSFGAYVLPSLPGGLQWNTTALATNGMLTVVVATPPVINSYALLNDGNFRLNFSGAVGQAYEIRATTDLALTPITSWSLLGTGTFTGGIASYDDLQATNYPQRYYLIRQP